MNPGRISGRIRSSLRPYGYGLILLVLLPYVLIHGCSGPSSSSTSGLSSSSIPIPTNSSSPSPSPTQLICIPTSTFYRVHAIDPSQSGSISPYTVFGDLTSLSDPNFLSSPLAVPDAIAVDLSNNEIFVANSATQSITVYSRGSFGTGSNSGNSAPIRTLSGSNTGLNIPQGLAIHSAFNELIVTNYGNNSITFYNRNANGNTAPIRTLIGSSTQLSNPIGVALDTSFSGSTKLWVTNYSGNSGNGSVAAYAYPSKTAAGNLNTAPAIAIASDTNIQLPVGIAVDNTANSGRVWVANTGNGKITIYNTSDGSVSAISPFDPAAIPVSITPVGIAIDTSQASAYQFTVSSGSGATSTLSTFSVSPNYTTAPTLSFSITGSSTRLDTPTGIAVDPTHHELLAVNTGLGSASVTVYSTSQSAGTNNASPSRKLSSSATGLAGPRGIAASIKSNLLAVSNRGQQTDSISFYRIYASGSVNPVFTLSGASTQLNHPVGVALDSKNIYVANQGAGGGDPGSVTVYAMPTPTPTGTINLAPLTSLTDTNGINQPTGIALDLNSTAGSYLYVANSGNDQVIAYPSPTPTWDSAITPAITITDSISTPTGIYIDHSSSGSSSNSGASHNEILVTNDNHSVSVYDLSSPSVALRKLAGTATLLNHPTGIVVDSVHNELLVTSGYGSSVLVFSRTAGGTTPSAANSAPIRVLSEANSGLASPAGITFCK